MRQRALTGYSRLFFVMRVVSIPVEAVLRTRIDVNIDRVPALDTCADSSDGIFRDVWIGFGEMEEKRAFQSIRFVQVLVDLDAVIANRGIDIVSHRGDIGELSAEAESHHADLSRAVVAVLESGDHRAEVAGKLIGVELCAE